MSKAVNALGSMRAMASCDGNKKKLRGERAEKRNRGRRRTRAGRRGRGKRKEEVEGVESLQ